MLAEKIGSVNKALSSLSHQVEPEVWEVIKLIKKELWDAYDLAQEMEKGFLVPEVKDESRVEK